MAIPGNEYPGAGKSKSDNHTLERYLAEYTSVLD
jgi:hypothetical protein